MRRIAVAVLAICFATMVIVAVQAATIASCTLDKDVYHQGETGLISVSVYNNKDELIRVTELTATIDYFYSNEAAYYQTFYTNASLPVEIPLAQSSMLHVPFSLPSNIASGYTRPFVRVRTEIWSPLSQRWFTSDTSTYEPVLFIESPYKEQYEQELIVNEQLEEQLEDEQSLNQQLDQQVDQLTSANGQLNRQLLELQAVNDTNTMIMWVLGITAIAFVAVIVFLLGMNRKARAMPQPAA